jgi:hypothetical protein
MEIERTGSTELTISGNIKSIEDSLRIKEAVNALRDSGARSLNLQISDSFSMTSTVIGNLMKLVHHGRRSEAVRAAGRTEPGNRVQCAPGGALAPVPVPTAHSPA